MFSHDVYATIFIRFSPSQGVEQRGHRRDIRATQPVVQFHQPTAQLSAAAMPVRGAGAAHNAQLLGLTPVPEAGRSHRRRGWRAGRRGRGQDVVVQRRRAVGHGLRAALAAVGRDARGHTAADGVRRGRAGGLDDGRRGELEEDLIRSGGGRQAAAVVAVHRGRRRGGRRRQQQNRRRRRRRRRLGQTRHVVAPLQPPSPPPPTPPPHASR